MRAIEGAMLFSSQWKYALEAQKETGHEEELHQRDETDTGSEDLEGPITIGMDLATKRAAIACSTLTGDSEGRQRRHGESGADALYGQPGSEVSQYYRQFAQRPLTPLARSGEKLPPEIGLGRSIGP
jgi:hypothetical protein